MHNFITSRREWLSKLAGGLFGFVYGSGRLAAAADLDSLAGPKIEPQIVHEDASCDVDSTDTITTFVSDSDGVLIRIDPPSIRLRTTLGEKAIR